MANKRKVQGFISTVKEKEGKTGEMSRPGSCSVTHRKSERERIKKTRWHQRCCTKSQIRLHTCTHTHTNIHRRSSIHADTMRPNSVVKLSFFIRLIIVGAGTAGLSMMHGMGSLYSLNSSSLLVKSTFTSLPPLYSKALPTILQSNRTINIIFHCNVTCHPVETESHH